MLADALGNPWVMMLLSAAFAAAIVLGCTLAASVLLAASLKVTELVLGRRLSADTAPPGAGLGRPRDRRP